ncbi:hypothetical protein CSC74_09260 [Pseudoxanthomonas yeongjuensis]|uniref:TonB-dependent receptor n=1 Tax=Pseudoxanthomonas yeongjuensis TaxID=377616 RepID=UPI001391C1F7|nr:TonB-dependent receptor [Pseudoxanthomonas yeongjuensis]KAF1717038.1 hypothetical protein CSC74_09260 [Pseudoxanthomonas yeongjuensis]
MTGIPRCNKALHVFKRVCLASMITLALAGNVLAQTETDLQEYDIPSGNLIQTVNGISQKSGVQIVYDIELLRGKSIGTIKGRLSTTQALDKALAGTGLTYEFINSSTVVLKKGAPTPAPRTRAAPVPARDPASGARTSDPATNLDTVRVTGSRLKRSEFEGASPVIRIDRQEIERTGVSTVRELINSIPQAAVAMDESGNNSWLGSATVQLRGLSYGSTLILINGRRVNASGAQASRNFFDLNTIPLEAIERVEILTDTASAIYGGDAIGGAINFILRSNYDGAVARARYGTSYEGDATEESTSFLLGGSGDRFEGTLVFEHFTRDALRALDRDATSTWDFRDRGGSDGRSVNSFPANIFALPGTGNLPGLNNTFAGVPAGTNGIGLTPADFAGTDGVLNYSDVSPWNVIAPSTTRIGVMGNGRYRLDNGISFYGELMHTRAEQLVEIASDSVYSGDFGFVTVPATNPFNPFGVDVGVNYRFVDLGPRQDDAVTNFTRLVVGAEGSFAGLDWDVSLLSDKDENTTVERNYIDIDRVREYLNMTDPNVALNVFSSVSGSNNPATLDAIRLKDTYWQSTGATMLEGSLSGGWDMFGTRLLYSFGAAGRRESLKWDTATTTIDERRDINSVYFEASLPFAREAGKRLEFNVAGRYDDYSDMGSSFNPQFGAVWKPADWLLLRASAGTAFKAPSLYDMHAPLRITPSSFLNDPLRNDEAVEIETRYGGNPNVKPEEGESVTAGFIIEPQSVPGLSFGASLFRVKQTDFITRFYDYNVILSNPDLFGDLIYRADPTAADIAAGLPGRLLRLDLTTLNFGQVVVEGIDFEAAYAFETQGWGNFVWTLKGSYVDSYEVLLSPGASPTEEVGHANRAGYPVKLKGNTGLQWSKGGWSASLLARYLHGYLDYDAIRHMPSQWWYDVQAGYDFGRARDSDNGFSVNVGVINASNNQGRFSNNFSGYDFQQADLRGRYFYANVKYKF